MNNITVCHISFNHQPFDDRIYWKEAFALKQAGYNVVHIVVADRDEDYFTKEGIRIIEIKKISLSKNLFLNRFLQFLFRKKGTINKIYKIANGLNASVFHYHDLQINAISKDLSLLPHKPKVIYDAHEAYHLLLKEEKSFGLLKSLLNTLSAVLISQWELRQAANCHYIITTDKYTLDYFEKKIPQIPKSIVYNYSFFLPQKMNTEGIKLYNFIYSGMMSRNRGIKEIILALKECKVYYPQVRLLLIGQFVDDSLHNEIINLIEENNLNDNITIREMVPFSEMVHYYKQSEIGLCLLYDTPKYSSAIPIKLFEYMAFRMPVIFSNHGPSSKIIKDANCGLLVDYSNIEMISSAMLQLLSDKNLCNELGENGMAAIENQYNWNKEQTKLLEIYDLLLNKP